MPLIPNITASKIKRLRSKIIAIFRYWIKNHWNDDFKDNIKLQQKMQKFIDEIKCNEQLQAMYIYLTQAFEKQKKKNESDDASIQDTISAAKHRYIFDEGSPKAMDILNFEPEVKSI